MLFSTESIRSLPHLLRRLLHVSALTGALALTGCSLLPEQIDMTKDWSAQRFYSEARAAMMDGDYEKSIDYYEKLQARFPYGVQAQQAQVDIIYAYYKYNEEESAIAAADRFIKLHPRHPNVDYVYYMRGLVRYNQGQDLLSKLIL
jgi:outer membrane protein assembly factor BamD